MESSYEGDTLILCRPLGFSVHSFDRPPQLGDVGHVIYALNEFSPLSSFVIRRRFGDLIIHCRQPGEAGSCLRRCCCCLPTPMALASGGSPMFPLVVHQPASPSIWPAVQSLRRGLSTNPGATVWCVCGCS